VAFTRQSVIMTYRTAMAVGLSSLLLSLTLPASASAQCAASEPDPILHRETLMTHATGTFEVKLAPQPKDDYADGAMLARLTIDKQFKGDLVGTSRGQMLSAASSVKGSAGYVAIELVTGALAGRRGTFVLQHSGTMNRGAPALTLTVVPDSGTGELTGLAGSMAIIIAEGKHSYEFDYTLPGSP
jgi:hypothetical protein